MRLKQETKECGHWHVRVVVESAFDIQRGSRFWLAVVWQKREKNFSQLIFAKMYIFVVYVDDFEESIVVENSALSCTQ